MPVIYAYKNCDTCRKALKWLAARGVAAEQRPIRETPPTKEELSRALEAMGGDARKLFNTSGADYRELGLKDRLPEMNREEILDLLSGNGNLVKRPLFLDGATALVGFKEAEWQDTIG